MNDITREALLIHRFLPLLSNLLKNGNFHKTSGSDYERS